ncbi:histidine kinase [Sphingomonas psychrotolerans]|uniref:Histidine kinase n=2 Tax=Sphingomonas psychrotolerans TaxID=1327635 RepID=A0A2K8MSQ5_9SPHN|nr:histidine kinase [Sphingomonas psychrotolerans]
MGIEGADFREPAGEPAMLPPDSVSWRVFRNPVTMYIGGIAAVLLELGEPRVRHGVWDHSSFKRDPAGRLRRTGLAAMITVYGARSQFEALAARVRRMHARVQGETDDGRFYAANDPELLLWVQATASWAFLEAYSRYAAPLGQVERDRYYAEARPGAALYGVEAPPANEAGMQALMARIRPQLEPSPVLDELIAILGTADILPLPLRPLQRLGVRAAVDLLPSVMRGQLGLTGHRLRRHERALLGLLAKGAGRFELPSSPARQAAARLANVRRCGPAGLATS